MKLETKRAIDQLVEDNAGVKDMSYNQLAEFLHHLGWRLDWVLLGQIYEYLKQEERNDKILPS